MAIDTLHVKMWIEENLERIHTIEDVAAGLHVSSETLRKDFQRHENIPLSEFITNTRVRAAQALLVNTELRCFEIAFTVGFSREDVCAKTFKREMGMTMEQYRELIRPHRTEKEPSSRPPITMPHL